MKPTRNVGGSIMRRLWEESGAARGTMFALVEARLRRVLAASGLAGKRSDTLPPLPTWNSGGFRVDIADRDAPHRDMEEDE